jgi:hypothetical protein
MGDDLVTEGNNGIVGAEFEVTKGEVGVGGNHDINEHLFGLFFSEQRVLK